jgi:hypothetical protein
MPEKNTPPTIPRQITNPIVSTHKYAMKYHSFIDVYALWCSKFTCIHSIRRVVFFYRFRILEGGSWSST